jgi:hypothetical protein
MAYSKETGTPCALSSVIAMGADGFGGGRRGADMALVTGDVLAGHAFVSYDGKGSGMWQAFLNIYDDMLHNNLTGQEAMAKHLDELTRGLLGEV